MRSPNAIKITLTKPDPNGKTWTEQFGDGFTLPLAGDWSVEGCHKYMQENYPDAYGYEIINNFSQNESCYWAD